jgi:hypothetical protein
MILHLLAAIKAEPTPIPIPGSSPEPDSALPAPRDIAPPVDIPMPLWETIAIIAGIIALLALIAWIVYRCWPRPLPEPPPTPRQIALRELARLRGLLHTLDPHAFSFEVSTVLRQFIEAQFGLRALEQTSDEFLAEVARASRFSQTDRRLLADFLERSDMIKYARQGADESASEALLASATDFVHGGRM